MEEHPCTQKIIEVGLKEVIYAIDDPYEKVAANKAKSLRKTRNYCKKRLIEKKPLT